jgi:hypothetical protein
MRVGRWVKRRGIARALVNKARTVSRRLTLRPTRMKTSLWSSGVLATLSRWRPWVRIPSRTLEESRARSQESRARVEAWSLAINLAFLALRSLLSALCSLLSALCSLLSTLRRGTQLAKRRSSNLRDSVGSTPTRATESRERRVESQEPARQPPVPLTGSRLSALGSQPFPTKWCNWQTRGAQNAVPFGLGSSTLPLVTQRRKAESGEPGKSLWLSALGFPLLNAGRAGARLAPIRRGTRIVTGACNWLRVKG